MITSERQYEVTREKADGFRKALERAAATESSRTHIHPRLLRAEREGAESILEELDVSIAEYEQLKTADEPVVRVRNFEDVAWGLVAARIGSGLSQQELAKKAGLTEQEVQRHEEDRYTHAGFQTLLRVAYALELGVEMTLSVPRQRACAEGPLEIAKVAEG